MTYRKWGTYLKWGVGAVALILIGAFLHWSLPSRDVVRILGGDVVRTSVEVENAQGEIVTRSQDVRYINAIDSEGTPIVYRNMDTGWGWPPYFKFDSANLSAEAGKFVWTEGDPRWVVVTHYGWRIPLMSMFPNALAISEATGPEMSVFPWFNIVIVALIVIAVLLIRRRILYALGWR